MKWLVFITLAAGMGALGDLVLTQLPWNPVSRPLLSALLVSALALFLRRWILAEGWWPLLGVALVLSLLYGAIRLPIESLVIRGDRWIPTLLDPAWWVTPVIWFELFGLGVVLSLVCSPLLWPWACLIVAVLRWNPKLVTGIQKCISAGSSGSTHGRITSPGG